MADRLLREKRDRAWLRKWFLHLAAPSADPFPRDNDPAAQKKRAVRKKAMRTARLSRRRNRKGKR